MMKNIIISIDKKLIDAIRLMDDNDGKLLIVTGENRLFVSILSIGDVQRYLIKHQTLDVTINHALRKNIKIASPSDSLEEIKKQMIQFRMEFIPIVNDKKEIENVIFWKDIIDEKVNQPHKKIDCPVVIMAGGKGTRLKPITNIIPKPLIPIGEKTISELIIDNFQNVGCSDFYMSVNYKADMIKDYFNSLSDKEYAIDFFIEDKPLGTAGSLHLIKDKIKTTFFVSNCDILIDQDYSDIYEFHKSNAYDLTLVSALKDYNIPYGILEVGENGLLKKLKEKPNMTYQVNAGLYVLEPHLLELIPKDTFFHITHLMETIKENGGKVGVFPVSEKSWSDIGEWKQYNETVKKLGYKPFIE